MLLLPYRSEVGPAAVVSRGYVSDVDDPHAAARLRVRTFAVEVPDPAEDVVDGGGVVTDHVRGLRQVGTVPADRKSQTTVKIKVLLLSIIKRRSVNNRRRTWTVSLGSAALWWWKVLNHLKIIFYFIFIKLDFKLKHYRRVLVLLV